MLISLLEMLLPIILLIGIGKFCRIKQIVTPDEVAGIKKLVTTICIPVLVFNAMMSASYGISSVFLIIGAIFVHFFHYFSAKVLHKSFGEFGNLVPYLIVCFECGMMGYTLVPSLVGNGCLSTLATMDMISVLFAYTIIVPGLSLLVGKKTESGLVSSLLHTPGFVAVVLGAICGLTKIGSVILNSPLGTTYTNCVNYLIAPITTIIIMTIGYDLTMDMSMFKSIIKPFALRIVGSALGFALTLFLCFRFTNVSKELVVTLIMYFALPATFLSQIYMTEEKKARYVSGYVSLSIAFTLIVFAILCVICS